MKFKHLILLAAVTFAVNAGIAQNKSNSDQLIEEGVKLNDEGKLAEAIQKYKEVLKAEPNNQRAQFELAYTLSSAKKFDESNSYLQNLTTGDYGAQASDLLASNYDDSGQPEKAYQLYTEAIKSYPEYERLRYNLGLNLFRQKKYTEAEAAAIEALKLDRTHTSAHWLYAMTLINQDRNNEAIWPIVNYMLLDLQTKRSAQAYGILQKIFSAGVNEADGKVTLNVAMGKETNSLIGAINAGVPMARVSATAGDKKNRPKADILTDELETVFGIAGELSQKDHPQGFFWKFYVDYFYEARKTGQIPVMAHLLDGEESLDENNKWVKEHHEQVVAFINWIKTAQRSY